MRPQDEYSDETEVVRRSRRIEPEPPDVVEERYIEPAPVYEERYVAPDPVEERYVERTTVRGGGFGLARAARLIYFVFGVIETLIAIRALLRLLGANRDNGFASFIYGVTGPFVAPFKGLFAEPAFGRSALELSSLVAIIVYALLAYGLVRLLYLVRS
ncbi:MAG: YggT family protein [Chloroflexota bacterium]|nr:YggT family protein [Chloroflexota bacterium]